MKLTEVMLAKRSLQACSEGFTWANRRMVVIKGGQWGWYLGMSLASHTKGYSMTFIVEAHVPD